MLGYGAGALVGPDAIKAAPGGVNSAAPLLAAYLGGPVLLGIISAVAFATILAVVAVTADSSGILATLFFIAGGAIMIWTFVDLGCLRGTIGPNQYGPDPLGNP